MTDELYIGLMSGTSMDGIDAVLVEIGQQSCTVKATMSPSYPDDLRRRLESLVANSHETDLAEVGALHTRVARAFAAAANDLRESAGVPIAGIKALGSHGQTVLHSPDSSDAFSMQLGDPGTLAALTGIPVVADFRNTDVALGGQGAPLVPAFHRWAFGADGASRAVVNIGGIANVTFLDADGSTTGYDTGPGNVLLDLWCKEHHSRPFDESGSWAAGGFIDAELLGLMRADPYFERAAPKSTGREYFNLDWLRAQLARYAALPSAQDVQATLSELTAQEIARAMRTKPDCREIAICGGGADNADLLRRIEKALPDRSIDTTAAWGIEPAWVEATAFAWLAKQRLLTKPTSIPAVTGARSPACLGGLYLPPR